MQRGHVEVAVEREGERPGNRRRGEEQHVRRGPLPDQRRALLDPEPVLLVDDREPQPMKRDALLHQRVRADGEPGLPSSQAGANRLLLRGTLSADQKFRPQGERCQQSLESRGVLLRQELRGRHQRRLEIVLATAWRNGATRLAGAHACPSAPVHPFGWVTPQ